MSANTKDKVAMSLSKLEYFLESNNCEDSELIFFFLLVAAWVYSGRSAFQSAEQGVRDAVSATTKRMFNIDKLCKNVQKATVQIS